MTSEFEDYLEGLELPEYHSPSHQEELGNQLLNYYFCRRNAARIRRKVAFFCLIILLLACPVTLLARRCSEEISRELSLSSFRLLTRLNRLTVSTGDWALKTVAGYLFLNVDQDTVVVTKTGSSWVIVLNGYGFPIQRSFSVTRQVEFLRREGRGRTLLGDRRDDGTVANVYRYALSDGRRIWASEAELSRVDRLTEKKMAHVLGLRRQKQK